MDYNRNKKYQKISYVLWFLTSSMVLSFSILDHRI